MLWHHFCAKLRDSSVVFEVCCPQRLRINYIEKSTEPHPAHILTTSTKSKKRSVHDSIRPANGEEGGAR